MTTICAKCKHMMRLDLGPILLRVQSADYDCCVHPDVDPSHTNLVTGITQWSKGIKCVDRNTGNCAEYEKKPWWRIW